MAVTKRKRRRETYSSLNKVELIRGGKPYFDRLLEMIAAAKDTVHVQTYILDDDKTGKMVVDALKDAVKRKVKVYLLADGYASKSITKQFIADMKKAGIHFRYFNP